MSLKLLIEFDIDCASPLMKFTAPNEVIRNVPCIISLYLTNLGENEFPGGRVTSFQILSGVNQNIIYNRTEGDIKIGKVTSGERIKLLSENYMPATDGLSWIICMIVPDGDDKEISYYQTRDDVLTGEITWRNWFYVVNRELIALTAVISELNEHMQHQKGGKE